MKATKPKQRTDAILRAFKEAVKYSGVSVNELCMTLNTKFLHSKDSVTVFSIYRWLKQKPSTTGIMGEQLLAISEWIHSVK